MKNSTQKSLWFSSGLLSFLIFLGLAAICVFAAESEYICAVCGKPITSGKAWAYHLPGSTTTNIVCDECHHLKERCSVCGLPVKDGFVKTSDGRIICQRDIADTILSESSAIQVFEETRNQISRMTSGSMDLKTPTVKVSLFDVDYWNYQNGQPLPDKLRRYGFSQTRPAEGNFIHNVILLSGLKKEHLIGVCAHEYTHLWLNENTPRDRTRIDGDIVEAICELVAYKVAGLRDQTEVQERIKVNPYTNGKILDLIKLDKNYGFDAILNWVKNGSTAVIDEEQLNGMGIRSLASSASPLYTTTPTVVQRAPETIELKGLLGKGEKRLALINDRAFAKAEQGTLRVGDRKLKILCVDILDKSVVIKVEGTNEPVTLFLIGQ